MPKRLQWKVFTVAVVAILVTLLAQSTLGYVSTVGTATNVVTAGNLRFSIHESRDLSRPMTVIPGDTVSQAVCFENSGTHPFYLRVKPLYFVSSEALAAQPCFHLNIDETVWHYRDGWYYYGQPVAAGETTPDLFTAVEIVGEAVDNRYIGKTLSVTVAAQAVQSENNPLTAGAVWTAAGWPGEATV